MGDSAWPGTALPCSGRAAGLACARVCVRALGGVGGKVIPGGGPRPVAHPCRAAPPPGAGRNRSDAGWPRGLARATLDVAEICHP